MSEIKIGTRWDAKCHCGWRYDPVEFTEACRAACEHIDLSSSLVYEEPSPNYDHIIQITQMFVVGRGV